MANQFYPPSDLAPEEIEAEKALIAAALLKFIDTRGAIVQRNVPISIKRPVGSLVASQQDVPIFKIHFDGMFMVIEYPNFIWCIWPYLLTDQASVTFLPFLVVAYKQTYAPRKPVIPVIAAFGSVEFQRDYEKLPAALTILIPEGGYVEYDFAGTTAG